MPKLKKPVVAPVNVFSTMTSEGVEVTGNDYGEFHPTAQLRSISDLPKGGVFKGIDFNLPLNRDVAKKYIRMTEAMKPADRIRIDSEIMRNKEFAAKVFKICKN